MNDTYYSLNGIPLSEYLYICGHDIDSFDKLIIWANSFDVHCFWEPLCAQSYSVQSLFERENVRIAKVKSWLITQTNFNLDIIQLMTTCNANSSNICVVMV